MSTDREPALSWRIGAVEIATSFVVAALFVWACSTIRVNPLDRTGQVSGIAAVELRLLWFGLPLLAILVLSAKLHGGRTFPIAARLVCASFAGMSSAAVAGGILVALGRSPYGLGGIAGDSGVLISWAEYVKQGINVSPLYPPLQTQLLAWMSEVLGMPTHYAMKWFQIVGIAAVGPLCYATWRLLLRPGWALGVGVLASVPLVEAYRQYPFLVLVVFIPLLVKFLDLIRHSYELSVTDAVRHAVLFGMALGALFLLYSGWYQWSAPGVLVAAAIIFPWRRPWRMAVLLGGLALFVFVLFAYKYLTAVVEAPPIKDDFFYFDASVEPAYIAMWRGDLPGTIAGSWPPLGELGGVGLFTVLLAVGIGVAIAFGYSHTLVITVGSIMAGTWLFRFWHAHNMYKTKLVQLYPRTTAELLYCGLILTLFGIHLIVERAKSRAPADSPLRSPFALVGACAGFLFLSMSSSAALTDKYMPKEATNDYGRLAWLAVKTPRLEQSQAIGAAIEVSSSYDDKGYSVRALVDGKRGTAFSSQLGTPTDHEEWIILRLPSGREFSSIVLTPAADGFPVDFAIELWDGEKWLPRIAKTSYPDSRDPQRFSFPQMEATDQIRIRATKLRQVGGDYVLRLAEIELYR
jgi:galactan 5-O-arabinofuranosyltransferase